MKKQNFQYPVKTEGASDARALRERSNGMTDKERSESVKRAMRRIYAAPQTTTVGP